MDKLCIQHETRSLSQTPLSLGLVPDGDCREGFDLARLPVSGTVLSTRMILVDNKHVVYWEKNIGNSIREYKVTSCVAFECNVTRQDSQSGPYAVSLHPLRVGEGRCEWNWVSGQECQSWRGTELAWSWQRAFFLSFFWGGVPCLAVSFYWSRWATSQWLLSCLYYAKTCILEGAWIGVECHTRTEI